MGHLARTLAVSSRWLDTGGSAVLATAALPEDWERRFKSLGVEVAAPSGLTELADQDAVLLVDGYHLAEVTNTTEGFRAKVGIDDFGLGQFGPGLDLIIDQSLHPSAALPVSYRAAGRRLLAQPFASRRPELRPAAPPPVPVTRRRGGEPEGPLAPGPSAPGSRTSPGTCSSPRPPGRGRTAAHHDRSRRGGHGGGPEHGSTRPVGPRRGKTGRQVAPRRRR